MKKIRLVKGFTLMAALMAVAFVFGCSSSSSTSEPVADNDYSTTVTETLALSDGGEITTSGKDGNARMGSATITIEPNTVAYYDLAGLEGVDGAINIEIKYSDKDSTATFGESFVGVNVDGDSATVEPEGWVDVKITDEEGRAVVKFDPPIAVTVSEETIEASNWNLFNVQEAHAMKTCPAYVKPLLEEGVSVDGYKFVGECNDASNACGLTKSFLASDASIKTISVCEIGNTDKTKERKFRVCDVNNGNWRVALMCYMTGTTN